MSHMVVVAATATPATSSVTLSTASTSSIPTPSLPSYHARMPVPTYLYATTPAALLPSPANPANAQSYGAYTYSIIAQYQLAAAASYHQQQLAHLHQQQQQQSHQPPPPLTRPVDTLQTALPPTLSPSVAQQSQQVVDISCVKTEICDSPLVVDNNPDAEAEDDRPPVLELSADQIPRETSPSPTPPTSKKNRRSGYRNPNPVITTVTSSEARHSTNISSILADSKRRSGALLFESMLQQRTSRSSQQPTVLTHFIDGETIEESADPFPISPGPYDDFLSSDIFFDDSKPPDLELAVEPDEKCAELEQQSDTPGTSTFDRDSQSVQSVGTSQAFQASASPGAPVFSMEGCLSPTIQLAAQAIRKPVTDWSVQEVVQFVSQLGGACAESAERFSREEIDGSALLLLTHEQMCKEPMSLKLGPALKIGKAIEHLSKLASSGK